MKIHGHPQKSDYLSPSEWPTISAQGHWKPSITPEVPTIGHMHIDVTCPMYAEVTEPIVYNFAVTLFEVAGEAFLNLDRQENIRDFVWDATGSEVAPKMIGDTLGPKTWTGHFTMDPTMVSPHPIPKKGWFAPKYEW
jgi:hypothetical protein